MMDQLGIRTLRPGANGNEDAPDHANYDESKANPYPVLPDALAMKNGQRVTTPEMWWKQRRPEIVEDFEREVIGRVPNDVPGVTWTVTETEQTVIGFVPVVAKHLKGHVDNSAYPGIDVDIDAVEVVPARSPKPVPMLILLSRATMPPLPPPSSAEIAKLNAALRDMLGKSNDPAVAQILAAHPAYAPIPDPNPAPFTFPAGDPPTQQQLIADGWGYVLLNPGSVQPDNGAGLTRGIIGLTNHGQFRKPDQWGALRAWSWGAARTLDYLETDPAVDSKHVGIEGVSRYGKAALVTLAFEPRFAMGLIGSSGEGGAKPYRRNWGEAVENLTSSSEYHWMAGNFLKYGASDATFGSKHPSDLPVDANELIALCAPRLTFISYGIPDKGDAKWLDQQGSFTATVAAQPVFELLGVRGVDVKDAYRVAKLPAVNTGLLAGQLAWRQHDGGHTDAPNVRYFLSWADRNIRHTRPPLINLPAPSAAPASRAATPSPPASLQSP